jgi:hypothetical protein
MIPNRQCLLSSTIGKRPGGVCAGSQRCVRRASRGSDGLAGSEKKICQLILSTKSRFDMAFGIFGVDLDAR